MSPSPNREIVVKGSAPVQAEGVIRGHKWYFRARGNRWEFEERAR